MNRRSALALALVLFVAACSDSTGPKNEPLLEGTYTLRTVNGAVLPFVLQPAPMVELTGDFYTLASNGTYTSTIDFRVTTDGVVTTESSEESGTFAVRGTTLTFSPTGSGPYTAMIGSGKITLAGQGITLVYEK